MAKKSKPEVTEEEFLETITEAETEAELFLAEDAEEKLDRALAVAVKETAEKQIAEADELLGSPSMAHPERQQGDTSADFPTDNHMYCRVKVQRGDVAPAFNTTLIIRK